MKKAVFAIVGLVILGGSGLRADFSYEQDTEMTGGVLQGAMKIAGVFSKKAREPMRIKTVFQGPRQAQIHEDTITITDLDAGTITTIQPKKKQYSVVTFEQMRQYMEQMMAKVQQKKEEQNTEVDMRVSVEKTGEKKDIDGKAAEEYLMRMQIQGQNPQTGESGAMEMQMRSWMTNPAAGYNEVQDYYRKFAQKMDWVPGATMPMLGQGQGQGMGKIALEAAKLEGMPLVQVVSMGAEGHEVQPEGAEPQGEQESIGSVLTKGLGGFGGFGRKKKEEPKQEPPPQANSGSGAPAALMVMTTTFSNYSNAAVDPALVDTEPAGFKRVESDIEKALK